MKLVKQLAALLAVVMVFALFNFSMYRVFTGRLGNNFSGASQLKSVEVANYLPFQPESDLARVDASVKLSGDLPVLDGAAALVPVYASVIENLYPQGSVTYEGGTFSSDNFYGENFASDSAMQYYNTVRGYKAIVDGDTDLFFGGGPSEEQKKYAQEQGVELVYVPIGREAFVFFVNQANPVNGLTSDQIRDVYAGDCTNWKDVGGPNRAINPVARIAGSGSQTRMEKFMGDRPFGPKSPFAITGGSLGYSFRFYLEGMVQDSSIKMLALDGVYPSMENIQSGKYPLVSEFYAVYRADNDNENIQILLDWILSPEGQEMMAATGYIPLSQS